MKQRLELEDLETLFKVDYESLYLWARQRDYLDMAIVKAENGRLVSKFKPLLTIGQLIEYLCNVDISKDEEGKWLVCSQEQEYRGEELVYLLFTAVKFKLSQSN